MSNLINKGKVSEVEAAIKTCTSRKTLRLALHNELGKKRPRKTVIELLERALET